MWQRSKDLIIVHICPTDQDWGSLSLWTFGQIQPDPEVSLAPLQAEESFALHFSKYKMETSMCYTLIC